MPSVDTLETTSHKPSGAVALPPVDLTIFESWRQVLNGANQMQRAQHTPEQLAQCISTLLARERLAHKAMVGSVASRGDVRTSIACWIEFDNSTKLQLKMPEGIEGMSEQGLIAHLKKHDYRTQALVNVPLNEDAFRAIAGIPLAVFRCFGGFYDDSNILHTAVPKTKAREFGEQLRKPRTKT